MDKQDVKTYRGKISYFLPILFFPIIFTIAILLEVSEPMNIMGFYVFWLWVPFILLILIPLGYKLEIGKDYIQSSFLNLTSLKLSKSNIESITYGGIGLWNSVYPSRTAIHGKGLAILSYKDGVRKTHGLSEKLYGKEAIENVKTVLGAPVNL